MILRMLYCFILKHFTKLLAISYFHFHFFLKRSYSSQQILLILLYAMNFWSLSWDYIYLNFCLQLFEKVDLLFLAAFFFFQRWTYFIFMSVYGQNCFLVLPRNRNYLVVLLEHLWKVISCLFYKDLKKQVVWIFLFVPLMVCISNSDLNVWED